MDPEAINAREANFSFNSDSITEDEGIGDTGGTVEQPFSNPQVDQLTRNNNGRRRHASNSLCFGFGTYQGRGNRLWNQVVEQIRIGRHDRERTSTDIEASETHLPRLAPFSMLPLRFLLHQRRRGDEGLRSVLMLTTQESGTGACRRYAILAGVGVRFI